MKVLVVKLTSMGDVLHLMPALSDLKLHHPSLSVDWMVEDSFSQIPRWHPCVKKVITVSTRRWRKLNWTNIKEFFSFWKELRSESYDAVIDAQGLMKSAVFSRFAKINKQGQRIGFSGDSIKETPAAFFYSNKVDVAREKHAIDRLRLLFADGFGYQYPTSTQDYSLTRSKSLKISNKDTSNHMPTVFLLHGTTWATKHLPNAFWRDLAELIVADGYKVALCWGNDTEKERANWIAKDLSNVDVLPKTSLNELKQAMNNASGAIAVDTGLGHLAAAIGLPCVSIYGSTDASLTGAIGENQSRIQSQYPCSPCLLKTCPKLNEHVQEPPCYQAIKADEVWQQLFDKIA